jgi:RNA polymerase sigma-70 factor (ECF subfamily)
MAAMCDRSDERDIEDQGPMRDSDRHDMALETDGVDRLIAAARGDSADANQALGELLDQWRDYLLLLANHQLDSDLCPKAGASDLVQETLMEAQQGFERFEGRTAQEWVHWLRQILRHNVDNFVRRYKRTAKRNVAREVQLEQLLQSDEYCMGAHEWELADGMSTPSSIVAAREEAEAVRRALAQLPAAYRAVIELRYQHGCGFEDIGRQLDRSADAARKMWFRAIGRLTKQLNSNHDPAP